MSSNRLATWTAMLALAAGGAVAANGNGTQASNAAGQGQPVIGVLTKVDSGKRMLTIVAPAGREVDVARIGKQVYVERGVDLFSVQAPLATNAKVMVDGNQANLSQLKEGDVVRASFDPGSSSFVQLNAVSSKQIDRDVSQAQSQLGKELNSQLGANQSK